MIDGIDLKMQVDENDTQIQIRNPLGFPSKNLDHLTPRSVFVPCEWNIPIDDA